MSRMIDGEEVAESRAEAIARDLDDFLGEAARPRPAPPHALPGTPEKLAVLAARARGRCDLHRPCDPDESLRTAKLIRGLRNGSPKFVRVFEETAA